MDEYFSLLCLPQELTALIITTWLDLKYVVARLDNAVCSKALRPKFLSAIRSAYAAVSPISRTYSRYDKCLTWCLLRHVKVDGLMVGKNLRQDVDLRRRFLKANGQHLRWATITELCEREASDEDVFVELGTYCPNLVEVEVSLKPKYWAGSEPVTFRWDERLVALTGKCKKLQRLSLDGLEGLFASPSSLGAVLNPFQQLQHLTIRCRWDRITSDIAIPSLVYLDIRACCVPDATVAAIGQKCPALRTLLCHDGATTTLSDRGARAVLEGCAHLQKTDVIYCVRVSQELRLALADRCGVRLEL